MATPRPQSHVHCADFDLDLRAGEPRKAGARAPLAAQLPQNMSGIIWMID
jgi:hypothetical protein